MREHPLKHIVRLQKQGKAVGIYSACTANELVLRACMQRAKETNSVLLIEATANQVDQYGGYTGMKPKDFMKFVEELAEIYKRRWAIETLYKQLKQNFPLHFFYGESVNAIQIQTWVVLIANLLCTVLSRMIKRHVSFSQIVTMLRLTLMYYTNFIAFMEDPQKDECAIWAERAKSPPSEPSLFD